uniref:Tyrosine-protein phosphatase domain-containing protein n=1 Tax=Amphimedon queenslandica TaxID=400682 RepID=A0A1X7SXS5_AMPQE
MEEDIDFIKANQGNISEDPYDLQEKPVRIEKKKKQLTAPDSGLQSIDTSFAIVTSQLKKEKETNKRLEEKLKKLKEKHCIQHMSLLTNTGSALSRIRRGMRMEIEELILFLTANKSDLQDQNAALAENKREMEHLQDQISSTSVQLLMKREESEAMKANINKGKQVLSNQVKLFSEKEEKDAMRAAMNEIFSKKGRGETELPDGETELPDGETELPDGYISIDDFPAHIANMHADDDYLFSVEYPTVEPQHHPTRDAARHPDNARKKNRYTNILAYDHSRVKLTEDPNVPGSDYINANYID